VAEGLALRSHGNPEDVKQGANSCPEGTLGRTKTVEASGKDERGKRPHKPLLIRSDEKGFFFAGRRANVMAMRRRHRMAPFGEQDARCHWAAACVAGGARLTTHRYEERS